MSTEMSIDAVRLPQTESLFRRLLVKSRALISRLGGSSYSFLDPVAISSLSTAAEHRTNNKYCKQFVWPGWGNRKPWQIFAHARGASPKTEIVSSKELPTYIKGGLSGRERTKRKPFGAINYHHQQMAMWFILCPASRPLSAAADHNFQLPSGRCDSQSHSPRTSTAGSKGDSAT